MALGVVSDGPAQRFAGSRAGPGGASAGRFGRSRAPAARERARAAGARGHREAAGAPARGRAAVRLSRADPPRGRPHARHRARGGAQALLARARRPGQAADRDEHRMTDDSDILTPDAERARKSLEALADTAPSAMFRARLQREFVAGTIAPPEREAAPSRPQGHVPTAPHGHAPATMPHGPAKIQPLRRPIHRHPAMQWALAAAAVLVVVSVGSGLNTGSPWRVGSVSGEGVAIVDEQPIPLNHHDELERALTPGAHVRVPMGCEIGIRSVGTIAIHMTSGTDGIVPGVPGRWFGRNVSGRVDAGEWRVMTGPRFHGAHLAIATPAAHVEVTGTTLAVICEPPGTCVCVYEGSVKVGRDRTSMVSVEEGRRRYVFMDPSLPMESDVMRPAEASALAEMHDQMESELSGE